MASGGYYYRECTSCEGLGDVKLDALERGRGGEPDEIYESFMTCSWCGGTGSEKVEVMP